MSDSPAELNPGRRTGNSSRSIYERTLTFLAVAVGLLILGASALIGPRLAGGILTSVVVPAAAVIGGAIALFRPRWIFYGFISACMVFPHELETIFVPLGFMKVYPQDLVFLFLIALCALLWVLGRVTFHRIPFNRLMVVYLALGGLAAAHGLFRTGNEYDNVFGDLRRSFFYFLAYFFAIALTPEEKDTCWLRGALLAGALGAIARGYIQVSMGAFESRRIGDAAHILNHFEVTFSTYAIYIALASLAIRGKNVVLWTAIALAGLSVVVLGNFRTCWIGLLAGLATMSLLLPWKHRRRLAIAGGFAMALGAVVLAFLWEVPVEETHSTIGENIARKADIGAALDDPNIAWRVDSYRNAIDLWLTQPMLGRGLGEELEFITATSTGGSMMAMGHRVHNSYLWLLMSLGVVGFSILVYIHGRYIFYIFSAMKNAALPEQARITLTAGTALYGTILASALFDVYLESAPPITIISITMALCLLEIHFAATPTARSQALSHRPAN